MDEHFEGPIDSKQRARIVASLDRMVVSGRLTKEEADRLRGADKPGRFDSAIRGIRVRHARANPLRRSRMAASARTMPT